MTSKNNATRKRRMSNLLFILLLALVLGFIVPVLEVFFLSVSGSFAPSSMGFVASAMAQEIHPPLPKEPEKVVPALENPKTGIFEAGKIIVTVSTTRKYKDGPSVNYGYRTGELIPVTMVISADPGVLIDLGALTAKTLNKNESGFEMVAPPVVTTMAKNGKNITILQLVVRSWVMDDMLTLSAQFHYSVRMLPDGKTPAWKAANTPDFIITTSRTATESSKQLLNGDTSEKAAPIGKLVWWLKYSGSLVLFLVFGVVARRGWIEWNRARRLTDAQRTWQVIDRVVRERETAGGAFTAQQLEDVGAVFRRYLAIESVTTDKVRGPLEKFFDGNERRDDMVTVCFSALAKLDRALYGKVQLTAEESDKLIEEIGIVVPRE